MMREVDTMLTLVVLTVVWTRALTMEPEVFRIQPKKELRISTYNNEDHFMFPTNIEYIVESIKEKFSLKLRHNVTIKPMRTSQGVTSRLLLVHEKSFSHRQVAIYIDEEEKSVVSVKCDSLSKSCFLSGSIHNGERLWTITAAEGSPDKYLAHRHDGRPADIRHIVREAQQWQIDGEEPLGTRRLNEAARKLDNQRGSNSGRSNRQKRDVMTTCNIFELVVVADVTVWEFFLVRNGDDATLARADAIQHYQALIREVDLIYSCLENLCLRVYLLDIIIQMNSLTDWSTDTGSGTVDAGAGIGDCADLIGTADGVICFTRDQLQFGDDTDFDGIVNSPVTCNNAVDRSGLQEENIPGGLARTVARIISLQITLDIFDICRFTNNDFNVDGIDNDLPENAADYPLTYMFSHCAQDELAEKIQGFNDAGTNCLLSGNISDADFETFVNNSLFAGELVALDHQCQLAYGLDSAVCQQFNEATNMTIETGDVCGPGVYCNVSGACENRTVVYSGSACGHSKICIKGVCTGVDCGPAPMVQGGLYVPTSQKIFGEATLKCFPGYTISSPDTISCTSNGWTMGTENCTLNDCGGTPMTGNGSYVAKDGTRVGDIAVLKCNSNYTVNSTHTCIVCGPDGNWSMPEAECIRNAQSCQSVNTIYEVCGPDGNWSMPEAECILDCGPQLPFTPNGAYQVITPFVTVGAVAQLFCADGYNTSETIQVICEDPLIFPNVTCQPVFCGDPPEVENGNYDVQGMGVFMDRAVLKCDGNYSANSTDTCIFCESNGEWSTPQTMCILDCGPQLPFTPNGAYQVITPFVTVGAVAQLFCADGYNTSETIQVICEDPLIFPNVTCQPVSCGDPPEVENGNYDVQGMGVFKDRAVLKCDGNYSANSTDTCIFCESNGEWSTPQTMCILDCGPQLPFTPNGAYQVITPFVTVGAVAQLFCADGYNTSETIQVICEDPLIFPNVTCQPVSCGDTPEVENGNYKVDGDGVFMDTAVLECDANYTANSSHTCISCGSDGQWSMPQAHCILDCGPILPPSPNGFFKFVSNFTSLGSVVRLCCCDGYALNETVELVCNDTIIVPNITCQPIECDFTNPENGMYVAMDNNKFGTLATLMCNPNYAPSTKYTSIVCQADGNYSTAMATCVPDCGNPPDTIDGFYRLDSNSTLENATAELICCNGTFTGLDTRITCEEGGWRNVTSCSDDPCPSASWVREGLSCYLFNPVARSYSEARDFCQGFHGAFLAQSDSEEENDFLKNYADNVATPEPSTGYWIGLVQPSLGATEIWLPSGDDVDYWNPGQPNDFATSGVVQQSCTVLSRGFGYAWDDFECDIGIPGEFDVRDAFALCEFPLDPEFA